MTLQLFSGYTIFFQARHFRYVQQSIEYIQGEHKSFPDYKHLLQENCVEYKHFFYST